MGEAGRNYCACGSADVPAKETEGKVAGDELKKYMQKPIHTGLSKQHESVLRHHWKSLQLVSQRVT